VFEGEVRIGVGALDAHNAEIVLFSDAPALLDRIEANDELIELQKQFDSTMVALPYVHEGTRPLTATRMDGAGAEAAEGSGWGSSLIKEAADDSAGWNPSAPPTADMRPSTSCGPSSPSRPFNEPVVDTPQASQQQAVPSRPITMAACGAGVKQAATEAVGPEPARSRWIRIALHNSWGDTEIGLTGIQVLDQHGGLVPVSKSAVSVHLQNEQGGLAPLRDQNVGRLVDGCDITTDEEHMWCLGSVRGAVISIDLGFSRPISAVKVYNYNASVNDSFLGVKHLTIFLDHDQTGSGFTCRKAPGSALFDFGHQLQLMQLPAAQQDSVRPSTAQPTREANALLHRQFERAMKRSSHNDMVRQDYVTPLLPYGFIIRLELSSTWGDGFYMGLNAIELFDCFNENLCCRENRCLQYLTQCNCFLEWQMMSGL